MMRLDFSRDSVFERCTMKKLFTVATLVVAALFVPLVINYTATPSQVSPPSVLAASQSAATLSIYELPTIHFADATARFWSQACNDLIGGDCHGWDCFMNCAESIIFHGEFCDRFPNDPSCN